MINQRVIAEPGRASESLWIWTWQTVAGGSIRAAIWSGVAQPAWLATAARMAARS
jgi:hypothetical protein